MEIAHSQAPIGKDYQMYVAKGLEIISSPQTRDGIVISLQQGDPVTALANTLALVIRKLDEGSRGKGVEVSDVVKMYGAHELITELAKVATAAGVKGLDEDHIALAFAFAVQEYIKQEIQAGKINPTKLHMQTKAGVRKLPPEKQQEIVSSIEKIQATAKRYDGGR